MLRIGQPTIEVLDRENEYHRIKVVFPMIDKNNIEKYVRGGIIKFTAENFPINHPLADLLTIQFRTGYEEKYNEGLSKDQ